VPEGELLTLRRVAGVACQEPTVSFHYDLQAALEHAEDRLLWTLGFDRQVDGTDLADAQICAGLDAQDLEMLHDVTRERCYGRGETLARPGDPTAVAWIVLGGVVTVSAADGPLGRPGRRLRSVGPGSILGEMALLSGAPRSAWVQAETPVRVRELTPDGLALLTDRRPLGAARLLRNVCGILGGWLRDQTAPPAGAVIAQVDHIDAGP
jgi:CRP-like cAMP-binding protein